jgi:DNA segregation ATPase FtsK/SpoIIIE-like protein
MVIRRFNRRLIRWSGRIGREAHWRFARFQALDGYTHGKKHIASNGWPAGPFLPIGVHVPAGADPFRICHLSPALALAVAALATWNVADPSYSYATGNEPTNILGYSGAAFADILMQFFGLASVVALLPVVAWALALISGRRFSRIPARAAAWGLGSVLSSAVLGCFPPPLTWPIPNGIGGVIGDMILRFPALFVGAYPTGTFATAVGCIFAVPTVWMMLFASGIVGRTDEEEAEEEEENYAASRSKLRSVGDEDEEDDDGWLARLRRADACLVHEPGPPAPPARHGPAQAKAGRFRVPTISTMTSSAS